MHFLMWFDADKKREIPDRIEDGSRAYADRFQVPPLVVLISQKDAESDLLRVDQRLTVIPKSYIRANNYWFGQYDPDSKKEAT